MIDSIVMLIFGIYFTIIGFKKDSAWIYIPAAFITGFAIPNLFL
jgi:hypothetical protein